VTKFRDQQGRIHRLSNGGERARGTPPARQQPPEPQMSLDDLDRLREDIESIVDELKQSPALKEAQELIDLIGLNAETIIEAILRDTEFHDISRDHGDKISTAHTEITLLTEVHKVVAEQITELFARVESTDASMQAQFLQVNQAIADEISARVSALTELQAQRDTDKAALNVRIDAVEVNAESALASTKQALIAQFTAADQTVSTALSNAITEAEANAESARVEQKNLILAQVNSSIGVVQQQVNTKVTAAEASALASTQVEAFKGSHFAALQQQFNVKAGELDSLYGAWSASYNIKINAGTIGGKPVIAGIGLSATAGTGSDIILMANRVAIVQPNYNGSTSQLKYPFVVGTVNGVSTVGITGQLLVDGSITAHKITTNTLAAITANAGTINGGTFKTHTLDSQGQVTNPGEFRAELSNLGNWPLWIGSGTKSSDNAVMWIDRQGNAMFKGKINADGIVGEFQERVLINWTGGAQTYQMTGSNNKAPSGIHHYPTLVEFALPAPKTVGESHVPYLDVLVEMNLPTASVALYLEVWEGGAWRLVGKREAPYAHLEWKGNDGTRPIMEKYIPFSAFCAPVSGARTFRIRAFSGYSRAPLNFAQSAHAIKVTGYMVGLR